MAFTVSDITSYSIQELDKGGYDYLTGLAFNPKP